MLKNIQELKNCELSLSQIKMWLNEYENYFHFLISESKCRKWNKWLNDKSTFLYPCVCSIREQDCIFIELYYKLLSVEETLRLYEKALEEYEQLDELGITLLEWRYKYQSIFAKDNVEVTISVKETSEPYKLIKLKIEDESFNSIRRFQKIYTNLT